MAFSRQVEKAMMPRSMQYPTTPSDIKCSHLLVAITAVPPSTFMGSIHQICRAFAALVRALLHAHVVATSCLSGMTIEARCKICSTVPVRMWTDTAFWRGVPVRFAWRAQ
eukprot:scaffold670739_cov65-Prasinocladus_malaysianus.AAC.1